MEKKKDKVFDYIVKALLVMVFFSLLVTAINQAIDLNDRFFDYKGETSKLTKQDFIKICVLSSSVKSCKERANYVYDDVDAGDPGSCK